MSFTWLFMIANQCIPDSPILPIVAWATVAPQLSSQVEINALVELNGEIYGGTGNNGNLFKWDGIDTWVSVATGAGSDIMAMVVLNGEIYALGQDTGQLFKWNGVNAWITIDAGPSFTPQEHGMIVVGTTIYAAMSGRLFASTGGAWSQVENSDWRLLPDVAAPGLDLCVITSDQSTAARATAAQSAACIGLRDSHGHWLPAHTLSAIPC